MVAQCSDQAADWTTGVWLLLWAGFMVLISPFCRQGVESTSHLRSVPRLMCGAIPLLTLYDSMTLTEKNFAFLDSKPLFLFDVQVIVHRDKLY